MTSSQRGTAACNGNENGNENENGNGNENGNENGNGNGVDRTAISESPLEEWEEPLGGMKNKRNGTRVDFSGSLVDSHGKRLSIGASVRSSLTEDKDSDDSEKVHDVFYPAPVSLSTKNLLQSYSKQGLLEQKPAIDFLKDDPKEMTRSRRLALRLLSKKWYNPNAGLSTSEKSQNDLEGRSTTALPSLKKAWAYFEHVTLMRYVVHIHNNNTDDMNLWQKIRYAFTNHDEEFENAKPGEKDRPTKLYDYISTPHMQLGDFGLGFGLYFSTLRAIGYILFVAFLISIFNNYYFASGEYDDSDFNYEGMAHLMRGSAVCTKQEWVPCSDCDCTNTTQGWDRTSRCGVAEDSLGQIITFIVKNRCLEDEPENIYVLGLINYAVLMFLLPTIYFWLGWYLEKHRVKFDEDEQTAQDYSIIIKNPPPKATNPRKWKKYFEKTFPGVEVVAVCCNVSNDLLVKALVKRREVLRRMEVYLDPGTPMDIDNLALLSAQEARMRSKYRAAFQVLFAAGLPELISSLVGLNTSIKGLAQLDYPCTNVFVTFEHEVHQRMVLSKLSAGKRYIRKNDPAGLAHRKYMFEGTTVLNACEATEPDSIRWQDLNVSGSEKIRQQLSTAMITFLAIYVCFLAVEAAESLSPGFGAAFCISAFNLGFPQVAKFVVDFEGHRNESRLQTSLYWKIAAFRWVNTAIVTTVITPFTETIEPDGLISQIAAIFFAEVVTTNVIQLTDVWGHIQRHILAPRAKTQDAMNLFFKGLEVELAERYTNMTKIMFLAFWYSSIFPGGLLFASVALTVNYYTDRFSLMRSWQKAPRVGAEISKISLNYFFSTALIFLAVMSSFYWSAFPFDNLCPPRNGTVVDLFQVGSYDVTIIGDVRSPRNTAAIVEANDPVWRFCNQDFILRPGGPDFPFMYREGVDNFGEWMSEEQQFLSQLFGWTSVAFTALVSLKFVYGMLRRVMLEFNTDFEGVGDAQNIKFHDVPTMSGYVPQVRSKLFAFPLLLCNCDKLGTKLIDWTDPDQDYGFYDLTKDADHVLAGSNHQSRNSFDRVKYWPPNGPKQNRSLSGGTNHRSSIFNGSFTSSY